jgi:hypothetical protein
MNMVSANQYLGYTPEDLADLKVAITHTPRPAVHVQHVTGLGMNCSDCHNAGTANSNTVVAEGYAVVPDESGSSMEHTFTYTPRVPNNGTGTCATACHNVATSGVAPVKATARISARHSAPSSTSAGQNYTVNLDGFKTACYQVNTATGQVTQGTVSTYTWDFPATRANGGASIDPSAENCTGNNVGNCTATWAAGGTNAVKLDVLCTNGETSSLTIDATGFDIGAGENDIPVFVATPGAANLVTLTVTNLDPDVADVQILWGDYTHETVTVAALTGGSVTHTYNTSKAYVVKVTTTNDGILAAPAAVGNTTNSNRYFYEAAVTAAP